MVDQKYINAYQGILTEEELKRAEKEWIPPIFSPPGLIVNAIRSLSGSSLLLNAEHAAIRMSGYIANATPNIGSLRDIAGVDASHMVGEVFDGEQHNALPGQNPAKKDYDESKLNYHTFLLRPGSTHLEKVDDVEKGKNADDLHALFPKGKEDEWPVLMLNANNVFSSPFDFFDGIQAGKQIISKIACIPEDKVIAAGTYYSERDKLANIDQLLARYKQLKQDPQSIKTTINDAAEIQANTLLSFLFERDDKGVVFHSDLSETQEKRQHKAVLRDDATAILEHIIAYGYSSAHMVNKDAFRLLSYMISNGEFLVKNEDGEFRKTNSSDANRLLTNARIVGAGGFDYMDAEQRLDMPREVNIVSSKDIQTAVRGKQFANGAAIFEIEPKDSDGRIIKDKLAGHHQQTYLQAILALGERQLNEIQRKLVDPTISVDMRTA